MKPLLACLCLFASAVVAQEHHLISFEKLQVSEAFHCEGASFGDLDQDGHNDLVSGPFWYAGPDFKKKHEIYPPKAFSRNVYSDNFFAFLRDFSGDGRVDVLFVGFPGKEAAWFENPGKEKRHWTRHVVFDGVDNESPDFLDVTGDGLPELVCQNGGRVGWAAPEWSDPSKPWKFRAISPEGAGGRFAHGLGVGDVNGDGRNDILCKRGWYEQPPKPGGQGHWTLHKHPFAGRGGAQMLVMDVDGDGDADVITSENAHGYGLYWFEQVQTNMRATFKKHRIMGRWPEENAYGAVIGNLHALALCDIDGDGLRDLVTGNRYWAHNGRDPGDKEDPAVYWFRLVRDAQEDEVRFVPQPVDEKSGVGTQVVTGDVNGDGWPDVVVGNKMGTFLHVQRRRSVSRAEWERARPKKLPRSPAILGSGSDKDDGGVLPEAPGGRKLNLDFETGDLGDWTATGTAFQGMPVKGDTVHKRRPGSRSEHAGEFWVGTYEKDKSDRSTGTLTSVAFVVSRPFASFLVGGGQSRDTRVELVLSATDRVVYRATGRNRENMHQERVDLSAHKGKQIFIRLVDLASGGWGHINFDHFRLHEVTPRRRKDPIGESPLDQKDGHPPKEAARIMTVPPGFKVELVAGEPDLHQPIALALDARGRVWVAQAFSYPIRRPEGEGRDEILVFEDTDGDGTYDKRTVFVDNLNLVSGMEVGFGGVWVGAAPHFMFIPDRDGDLEPDGPPQILLDGWGFQDTHETLNAFNWGPDGWLYGCHGVFTHSRVGKPGIPDEARTPLNAAIWRYHPTRHEFEVFAWGTSNPWGVDFDDQGQAIASACVIPHLFHVIQGARYHRQSGQHFNPNVYSDIRTIADHLHYVGATPHAGNNVSGAVGGGHAHCGLMIYLGDTFPDTYRNAVLMNNVHGNRVNMDVLVRKGSGFAGRHGPDFLLANDRWFRGINLRCGPDGGVFLIDWYDQQACHLRNPEIWDRSNGRLYKISHSSTQPVSVKLAAHDDEALVALHLHKNDWYVRTARRILQQRGASSEAVRSLLAMLKTQPDPTRRLRALWSLHVLGALSDELALGQLESPDEYVRAWTIQLMLEDREASPAQFERLVVMAREDPSPVVRLYLASGLQRLSAHARWPIIEGLVSHDGDRGDHNLPLMIWYALEPLVPADPARALEVAAASRLPSLRPFVYRRLAVAGGPALEALVRALGTAATEKTRSSMMTSALRGIVGRRNVTMPATWPAVSRSLCQAGNQATVDLATRLAVIFGDASVFPRLRAIVVDARIDRGRRSEALGSLLRARDKELVPLLQALLDDASLRGPALRGLAAFEDRQTPVCILDHFQKFTGAERTDAIKTLVSRSTWVKALLGAIEAKVLPKTILDSATTRREIASLRDDEVNRLMEKVWGRSLPTSRDKQKEIERFVAMFPPAVRARADLSRGRAVFARTCMKCHKLFGVGREVGPELTGSNRADPKYILTNVVDPSAEVARDYRVTILETEDGRTVTGIKVTETEQTITIKTENEEITIALSDVALDDEDEQIMWTTKASMMPEDQLLSMSKEEIRDLLGYLASARQVPMAAEKENLHLFFTGSDLQGWDGDPAVWSVEDGEIVGRTEKGLSGNSFLRNHLLLRDFRLTLEVKLLGDRGNSGIQFRSATARDGTMRGHQADVGRGWWGKLYEEHGRGLLWKKPGDSWVRQGEWNTYEILARGSRIQTALNGHRCVNLDDPDGARSGLVGLQVHAGGPMEVRFRNFQLELDPEPVLKTAK